MNSELVCSADRLGFLSSKYWKGMVTHEGPRISVGANPYLMAWHVKDLTFEIDYKSSREVFRWTQVPGRRYNEQTHEFEDVGQPMRREESLPYGEQNAEAAWRSAGQAGTEFVAHSRRSSGLSSR